MKQLVWVLTFWLALTACVFAAEGQESFDDPVLEARYRALIHEVRCPKCPNASIAESNAPIASDLRREVRRLMTEGKSDDEVKAFLAERYGEFVLYKPRLSPTTALLWASPFVFLGLGGLIFWRILAARSNQPLDEELPP